MVRRGTRRTAQKETAVEQSENAAPLAPPKEVKITKKAAAVAKKNAPQTEPVEDAKRRGSLINLFDKIQYGKLTDENALSILVHLYTQVSFNFNIILCGVIENQIEECIPLSWCLLIYRSRK